MDKRVKYLLSLIIVSVVLFVLNLVVIITYLVMNLEMDWFWTLNISSAFIFGATGSYGVYNIKYLKIKIENESK